jgi:hypothetical protein
MSVMREKKVELKYTFMIFSKSFTYAISPLISSKIILIQIIRRNANDEKLKTLRLAFCLLL